MKKEVVKMRNLGEKQWLVLKALEQVGGKATPAELAERTGLPGVRVHQILTSLAARGLVRRVAWGVYELVEGE